MGQPPSRLERDVGVTTEVYGSTLGQKYVARPGPEVIDSGRVMFRNMNLGPGDVVDVYLGQGNSVYALLKEFLKGKCVSFDDCLNPLQRDTFVLQIRRNGLSII